MKPIWILFGIVVLVVVAAIVMPSLQKYLRADHVHLASAPSVPAPGSGPSVSMPLVIAKGLISLRPSRPERISVEFLDTGKPITAGSALAMRLLGCATFNSPNASLALEPNSWTLEEPLANGSIARFNTYASVPDGTPSGQYTCTAYIAPNGTASNRATALAYTPFILRVS